MKAIAPNFVIRPAAERDRWLIVRRILREGLDPTKLDWRRFVVAEAEDGRILGFAQMKDLGQGVQEFGSLVVESTARGQGIGGALLHFLVDGAQKPVYLLCGERNVDYYRRFGFREMDESEMPAPLRRKWRAGNFFARRLGQRVALQNSVKSFKRAAPREQLANGPDMIGQICGHGRGGLER